MPRPPFSQRSKALLALAMLLCLVPMWFWNQHVACLPLDLSLQLLPGQLIASRSPLTNESSSWFNGSSTQPEFVAPTGMSIDLQTGRWKVGPLPLVVVQNSQRFTFKDVPSMNGYQVLIEDLKGVTPAREHRVNVIGRPILVGARYLVWSRRGFFEVVDLSVDASALTSLDSENFVSKQELSLTPIPGSDCFYSFSLWGPDNKRLCLFTIKEGRVASLGEWAIGGAEIGFAGRELLTCAADDSVQIHSLDDGRFVGEVANPFDRFAETRLCGRLLIQMDSTTCIDVKTRKEIIAPFKLRQPQAMNDSLAVFVTASNVHPSQIWVYDFETGRERFHTTLPATIEQVCIDDDHLVAVSHAHALTAYTLDLGSGKILRTLEPYRFTSRSAGLLALCLILWCVGWIWLQPTGKPWFEILVVFFALLWFLSHYQSTAHTMVIMLVVSGFALWHACLSPGELLSGASRSLLICVAGLYFLPEAHLRSRYLWLLGIWWVWVVLLQVALPRWLGFRLISQRWLGNTPPRMSILKLMSLMTLSAVLIIVWRNMDWSWMRYVSNIYLTAAVAMNGCLLGLTAWLGLWQRRWRASGRWDVMLALLLLSLILLPRLLLLWYGHSVFARLDGGVWSTWSDFLAQDTRHPVEILWESAAICLIFPYLLAVSLRYGGYVLQKRPLPLSPSS